MRMEYCLRHPVAATAQIPSAATRTFVIPTTFLSQRRCVTTHARRIHTTSTKGHGATLSPAFSISTTSSAPSSHESKASSAHSLAVLPLSQVLRTWLVTSVSSSPRLMGMGTSVLRKVLESRNPLFSLDRNPILKAVLWQTFYKQFCAGETPAQVTQECRKLRQQGYAGVILEYALEVLEDTAGNEEQDVATWQEGILETVRMASPGDFIGLKWSGMGSAAMQLMKKNELPTERMAQAMKEVCQAAAAKDVALLPSAEETWTLDGYHSWSLYAQRKFNRDGKCVVYNTYQAYLKRAPRDLEKHLSEAAKQGYTIGVKVVRGAYLDSEERSKIWSSIEETHHSYDSIASALLQRQNNDFMATETWPKLAVVLATHNAASVQNAQALRQKQAARGEPLVPLAFAQLQGMADEVSCELVAASKAAANDANGVGEKTFKFISWGPMYECMNYLLRRAAENKDAAGRTSDTRDAMKTELLRRLRGIFGLT